MFKFLKSKKGFTLVELMIVVVIMAILVAVAVPIYSAVTTNAKTKTCIANMREIVSQINNYAMSNSANYSFKFTIKGGDNVKAGIVQAPTGGSSLSEDSLTKMFQVVPYCPAGGNYEVTVAPAGTSSDVDGSVDVKVKCTSGVAEHVYGE